MTAPTTALGWPYGGAESVLAFSAFVANFMKSMASAARGDWR